MARNRLKNSEESYYAVLFSKKKDNLALWTEFASYGYSFKVNPHVMFEDVFLILMNDMDVFDIYLIGEDLSVMNTTQIKAIAGCIAELLVYYGILMKLKKDFE